MRTKKSFEAMLPATPCDNDMRAKIVERAAARGVSLAEMQREAFAFFLRRSDRKSNMKSETTTKE